MGSSNASPPRPSSLSASSLLALPKNEKVFGDHKLDIVLAGILLAHRAPHRRVALFLLGALLKLLTGLLPGLVFPLLQEEGLGVVHVEAGVVAGRIELDMDLKDIK